MVFLDQSKTIIQIFNYLWDRRFPNYNSFSRYDKKTYLLCEKRWNDYVSDHLYELSKTCKAIGASYEKEKKIMFPEALIFLIFSVLVNHMVLCQFSKKSK